jgi:hypothetical protein
LTVTDITAHWTEERALKNKAHRWARQAMDDAFASFPVPLKGVDSDNGGEFINSAMKAGRKRLNILRLQDALEQAVDQLLQTAQRY